MSQVFFFPDNTVLINFTLLDRQDLVEWFTTKGTRQWTLSVCRECANSARLEDLKRMVAWGEIFGDPLFPTQAELLTAYQIAEGMRLPGETTPGKHMGEAETIAIAESRFRDSVFLTDDHEAARLAKSRHLQPVSTTKIIAFAEVGAKIVHDEARGFLAELQNRGRVLGDSPKPSEFDAYVRNLRSMHRILDQ